jgi:anti-sigma regulatory factor (Ser/Thr protein kinase)
MILGNLHRAFPMAEASRVGEARRHAVQLARETGFDETAAGRVALVVTELGNNLVRHARHGQLLISARASQQQVEVISIDDGPGIADVHRCLGDGYSTGGTPGTGLGAVQRLASAFDIHSAVPHGTVILARLQADSSGPGFDDTSGFCVGAISLAAPGEVVCGDAWALAVDETKAAILVVDGLGHGPDAARAADEAVRIFSGEPWMAPREQLARLHAGLRGTRGAALSVLRADGEAGTIRSAGAGNVLARLVSGTSDRTLLGQHGTAGLQIRTPEEVSTPWPAHALLVVYSDGIESRWQPEVLQPVLSRHPLLAAAILVRDHCRGRDDATVLVLRRKD